MSATTEPKPPPPWCGKPDNDPLLVAVIHVILGAVLICVSVLCTGLFDGVATDLGLGHYTELIDWWLLRGWLPMPFNSAVNIGYLIVGMFWISRVRQLHQLSKLSDNDCYLFYVFSSMAIVYGPVQLVRIITQSHASAVLDQWYTLPIFAWVGIWCGAIGANGSQQPTCGLTVFLMMAASCMSYGLAVVHHRGFEIALGVHIIAVVCSSWLVHQRAPAAGRQARLIAFLKAIACCCGFIGLKLADHCLVELWPSFFSMLSGHFWSKIADFLQIHYTCEFFLAAVVPPSATGCHKIK